MGMLALAWERGPGCALEGPAHSDTSECLEATNPAITEVDNAEDGQQASLAVGDNTTVTYVPQSVRVYPAQRPVVHPEDAGCPGDQPQDPAAVGPVRHLLSERT